ncbi:MAG: fumarylacetoacetate hydrolase family protein [Clostridiales bacterium]|nr:fumarylacetoacetate hydrolase family protein [Clostridiales bacterium]
MKLCNFYLGEEVHIGAETARGIVDITAAGVSSDMNSVIANAYTALPLIASICADESLPVVENPRFANVTVPNKLACVGLNYKSHAEETGGTAPAQPVIFSKFNDQLCPDGTEVSLPSWLRCFDYETELVIVIGRHAWNVSEEEAMDYVFGYTVGNDLSARDSQFVSNQWLIGKSLPDFSPAGPFIVTADSFDPNGSHAIRCRLNGELVQNGNTNDMIFNCAQIVSYCSRYFTLDPGDLIYTGTPAGVILGHKKGSRVWLKPGDELELSIDGICTLKNKLV